MTALGLAMHLKLDVGSSFIAITYMAESRKIFTLQGYGGVAYFFSVIYERVYNEGGRICQELGFRAF